MPKFDIKKLKIYNKTLVKVGKVHITKDKINLLTVLKFFIREVQQDNVQSKAQAMAFNFILAIFPGIIFLFTLVAYLPIADAKNEIMYFISSSVPASMYDLIADTIEDILLKPRGGLLSLGFILSLYAAVNGTASMIDAFNDCYKTQDKRGFLMSKLVAIGLTLLLVFVLIFSIITLNVGEFLLGYFSEVHFLSNLMIYVINIFRYAILVGMFFIATSVIYYIAPTIRVRWGFFSHGAILATIINMIVSVSFSIYINNFASYNKLYGSIGSIIGMMLWFYLTSLVLLIGFEFNASIDAVKHIKKKSFEPKN